MEPLGIRLPLAMGATARAYNVGAEESSIDKETVRYLQSQTPVAYEIVDGMSVEAKVAQLNKRRDVALAEPDYKVELFRSPSDPLFINQWHHKTIGSNKAWDMNTGSSQVKVCVIDSGANMNHPDLASNVIKGWNVVPRDGEDQYPAPGTAQWANYNDTLGHGTHVAGLVGAVGNNKRGVSGVSWRAGLLLCRFITDNGAGYISDAITCIRLCQKEGAKVYSNSWGGVGYSGILHEEIKKLKQDDALFVVAAGNNNGLNLDKSPLYPASYKEDNVLTVASTTSTDAISAFSNVGASTVHIAAPGSTIYSTTVDGSYGIMSGTSMSAPISSGAAALIMSYASRKGYKLSAQDVKTLLMQSSTQFTNGKTYTISGGRLNVYGAMKLLKSKMPKTSVPAPILPKSPTENIPTDTSNSSTDGGASSGSILCGTTGIRGRPAYQSSTYKKYTAANANDGDCRSHAKKYPSSCAITDPKRSHPWWTSSLSSSGAVTSVMINTRADCCSQSISGAKVYVGNQKWSGSGDAKYFELCGKVPGTISRGTPIQVQCSRPVNGMHIAIYLPKKRTSLSICEVDVLMDRNTTGSEIGCQRKS